MSTPPAPWQGPLLLDITNHKTGKTLQYRPSSPLHVQFHQAPEDNVFLYGTRGSAKSWTFRHDAHMRAFQWPGFKYAILRRTVPQLRKSHISFLYREKNALGAEWNATAGELRYPTDPPSVGYYFSVDDENALENVLGAEFGAIYIDEAPNFPWDWIVKIGASIRVPEDEPYRGVLRLAGNPIGVSAADIHRYYIEKSVDPLEDPEYEPEQFRAIKVVLSDNPHIDAETYRRRFAGHAANVRKAWLDGDFVFGGRYFEDFTEVRHVVDHVPSLKGALIYRAIDWGWNPDPTVCLWIAVWPSGREIVFKERTWTQTTAKAVAAAIVRETGTLKVRQTFGDPSMWDNDKATGASIGRILRHSGVPVIPSRNDREAAGLAIHEHLGQILDDGKPRLQVYGAGCPGLVRQFTRMVVDPKKPERIPDGDDHQVITCGYFCMGNIRAPLSEPETRRVRAAMVETPKAHRLGSESLRFVGL